MVPTTTTQPVRLQTDAHGAIQVGSARVSLDVVVAAFSAGGSTEEIAHRFPTPDLGDVYAVIAYYLHNEAAVHAYLAAQQQAADAIRRNIESQQHPDPLGARLVALRTARGHD